MSGGRCELDIIETASIVKLSVVRLSVCPSHHSAATRPCGGFAAVGPATRRYRSQGCKAECSKGAQPVPNVAAAVSEITTGVAGDFAGRSDVSA